ncbi:hypothetical protein [Clostridium fermenticellae]|uniref:hypothetical protein n=1 Tax=Clostridium fermenticellae TaxID=2068654 RepID=UPI001A9AF2C6|nr:hypothetical protein [Clostridium fermenticellae]
MSTFMGIQASLEHYAEMFNNKYLPFFQSKIMSTIGCINIIMLVLMAFIVLYKESNERNDYYIFYKI